MNQAKQFELHALHLGKIVGNLLTLEFAARLAISKLDPRQAALVQTQLPQVKENDWVEVNPLTNADDLGQTLEKYNKRASADCRVDVNAVVRLRDALAHGRAFGFGSSQRGYLTLLKFARKPDRHNRVKVTMAIDMTDDWFKENIEFLLDATRKVAKAMDYEMRDLSSGN